MKRTFPEGSGRNALGDEVLSVSGGVGNSNVQEGEILDARREYAPHVNAQLSNKDGVADQLEAEEGEIIEVDFANRFPEGSCQYSPKVNASEESVTSGFDYAVKVEIKSAVLEADSSKQFPEDCVQCQWYFPNKENLVQGFAELAHMNEGGWEEPSAYPHVKIELRGSWICFVLLNIM